MKPAQQRNNLSGSGLLVMAFIMEFRVLLRKLCKSVRGRPHQLQTGIIGVLIIVVVLLLSGPGSRRKEIVERVPVVRTHFRGIPDTEGRLERRSGPNQILYLCHNSRLKTLFFVHTSPDRFLDRKELRYYLHRPPTIAIVFMLGSIENSTLAEQVAQEAELFEDMVLFDTFVDSYRNLTLKFVHSIRWILRECGTNPTLENIVKVDDDVWVNLPMLESYLLHEIPKRSTRIHCLVWRRVRAARRLTSKWFVSKAEYAPSYYPPYCGGLAYIIPRQLLPALVDASYKVPFFWVDDVYATGLLARHAHLGHAQITTYYAFRVNESADFGQDWQETMMNAFGATNIMFAHMNTPYLRDLRSFLFQTIDETILNYTQFSVF